MPYHLNYSLFILIQKTHTQMMINTWPLLLKMAFGLKMKLITKYTLLMQMKISNNLLINVSIHEFDNNFQLVNLITSKKINISSYEWILTKPLFFKENKTTQLEEEYLIKTHFDIKKINSLFDNLSSLSFSQLLELRYDYKSLGNSTREVDIHLQKLYSLPLFISIMTIFSSIIMFNNKRNTSIIFHLLLGILLSVIIYYLSYLSYLMGENGKIPIILSTYLPIVILILITLIGTVRLNEK